jgi:hypothetical protein
MHLKYLLSIPAALLCLHSTAQTPPEADRAAYETCIGSETPVQEYDCLSAYLSQFPDGAYRVRAQKRLNELNNVPQNALKKAVETALHTKDCRSLVLFESKYAYNKELVQEAVLKRKEICPQADPCANISRTLYLDDLLAMLKNPAAGENCRQEAKRKINAIEDKMAGALDCNNVLRYLALFPKGRYLAKADSVLNVCSDPSEIAWRTLAPGKAGDLQTFLYTYPNSHRRWEAQKALDLLDDRSWASALQSNAIAGFEDYLKLFPDGRHHNEARTALEERRKSRDNEAFAAFRQAMKSNNIELLRAFLEKYPNSRYKPVAQREIKRLSPPRYAIEKSVNLYIVTLENLENPRVLNPESLSDSLFTDLSNIGSNQITFIPLKEGKFTIPVMDDWNKRLSVTIDTRRAPFNGEMTVQNDSLYVQFFNAEPPFDIAFTPLEGGNPVILPKINRGNANYALKDLFDHYGLWGDYLVRIEKDGAMYADLHEVTVPFPTIYRLYIITASVVLVAGIIAARWIWRVRRIRRKMRALR